MRPTIGSLGACRSGAAAAGAGLDFALGSAGAGLGATTVNLKGGLGSASDATRDGSLVGAITAVNAVGSATIGSGPWFWAAPFDRDGVAAYLEASSPRNRVLYERHGFEVTEEFTLGRGSPPLWRMWRAPRAATLAS